MSSEAQGKSHLQQGMAGLAVMRDLAIYIHYPFCKSKCPYCDFNSHVREKTDGALWREAYLKELAHFRQLTGNRNITSIFFGGGTPSLMEAQTVEEIISFIAGNWQLQPSAEITLEANPTSVEYGKFKDFRQAGVNRVSIGVQSFNEAELKFLGREHSPEEAKKAISYAQEIFPRYSFDLIYALPKQTLAEWSNALMEALKLTNGHISLYQLTIEQNTNFFNQYRAGNFTMPESDLAAEFFELTQEITEVHNLPAYEISNHAGTGQESAHNLAYWRYADYLGIGPGAHGRALGHASVMARSPEKWLDKVATQNHGLEEWTELSAHEKFEEKIMMGMRLKSGISLDDGELQRLKNLPELRAEGFIEYTPTTIRPTAKGLLMLNAVVEKLLA